MSESHKSQGRRFARRTSPGRSRFAGIALIAALLLAGATNGSLVTVAFNALTLSAVQPCTLYASPSGEDGNSGKNPKSPKTFSAAAAATRPGSVVCLLGGTYFLTSTFKPPASGTPSSWITYRSTGNLPVKFLWAGLANASPMFDMNGGDFPSNPAYIEFRGLSLDGGGKAGDGFFCRGSHHLRFIANSITNTGGSGIGSIRCDYLMVDHNIVAHNGYISAAAGSNAGYYSWTSGISLNSNQWYDSYRGFHNIISNNIVTGEVDQSSRHSDGNGIILDLSDRTYNYSSANTPPALIVNNVVYANGGRCIEAFVVTTFWIVNNTCYKNNLDPAIERDGSIIVNNARDGYIINNIVVAGNVSGKCYDRESDTANLQFHRNLCFGGAAQSDLPDPQQVFQADPMFLNPPSLRPRGEANSTDGLDPSVLKEDFALDRNSPAVRKGIDPTMVPNLPEPIITDLKKYVYTDINGKPRPRGGAQDLGAYQYSPQPLAPGLPSRKYFPGYANSLYRSSPAPSVTRSGTIWSVNR